MPGSMVACSWPTGCLLFLYTIYLDGEAGCYFTLGELQRELANNGHTFSKNELKESLFVGNKSTVECWTADGEKVLSGPLFSTAGLSSLSDFRKQGSGAKCYMRFNYLVTRSIEVLTFRQFNYELAMELKSSLARYLLKRLSYNWRQVSHYHTYNIKLTTVLRDSGRQLQAKIQNSRRTVEAAFQELVEY